MGGTTHDLSCRRRLVSKNNLTPSCVGTESSASQKVLVQLVWVDKKSRLWLRTATLRF